METVPAKHLLQKTRSPPGLARRTTATSTGAAATAASTATAAATTSTGCAVKENAIPLLRQELAAKRQTGVVSLGAMGDSYNPFSVLA